MHRYIRVPELYGADRERYIEETDDLVNRAFTKILLTGGTAALKIDFLDAKQLSIPYIIHGNVILTSMGTLSVGYHEKYNHLIVRKI